MASVSSESTALAPPSIFLHRVFEPETYRDNGTRLVEKRIFKPRRDCEEFPLPERIDWEAPDFVTDRNWRMLLQSWAFFHPVMNFFDTLDDPGPALDFFFSAAQDWWDKYGDDPHDIVTSRMPDSYAWYDMSAGYRALVISFVTNRVRVRDLQLSDDRRELLDQLVDKHVEHLSVSEVFTDNNNHGIFQAHGLMALGQLALEGERRQVVISYAVELMDHLVSNQFGSDGVHLEHSPHYHFFVLDAFESAVLSGWYPDDGISNERIRMAGSVLPWLVDPRCRTVTVGDSLLSLQGRAELPMHGTKPVASSFESSGYAVTRSGWGVPPDEASMVFMMGGYHSKVHKHRDCLSFDWFDRGERIICDSGKYGYRTDQWRRYALSARAHNSVEIENFDILKMGPYGSALDAAYVDAEGVFRLGGALRFKAVRHERQLYSKPGAWLIVEDTLRFARKRSFTQWFHLDGRFSVVSAARTSVRASADDDAKLDLHLDCLDPNLVLKAHRGDENSMQGFLYTKDYQVGEGWAIGFEGRDSKRRVVTLLSLSSSDRSDAFAYALEHDLADAKTLDACLEPVSGSI